MMNYPGDNNQCDICASKGCGYCNNAERVLPPARKEEPKTKGSVNEHRRDSSLEKSPVKNPKGDNVERG
jgi:hypothetical protein